MKIYIKSQWYSKMSWCKFLKVFAVSGKVFLRELGKINLTKWSISPHYFVVVVMLSSYAEENEFSVLNEWMDNQNRSLFFRVV